MFDFPQSQNCTLGASFDAFKSRQGCEKLPGGDELVGVGREGVHPLGDQGEVGEHQSGGAGEQEHHG